MFITIQYSKTKFLSFWTDAQNVKKQTNINTDPKLSFYKK